MPPYFDHWRSPKNEQQIYFKDKQYTYYLSLCIIMANINRQLGTSFVEKIHQHCNDYISHLGHPQENDSIGQEKLRIATRLLATETPDEVSALLEEFRETLNTHRYTTLHTVINFLKPDATDDWVNWFKSFPHGVHLMLGCIAVIATVIIIISLLEFILIASLLAFIILTAVSLITRNTLYFWKTTGALFADNLITRLIPEQRIDLAFDTAANNILHELTEIGHKYSSIDTWLDTITTSKDSPSITTKGNNTLLHLLTTLPVNRDSEKSAKIKLVASHLKHLCYQRNELGQTPLFALNTQDPYQLNNILVPTEMVEIGNQMQQIRKFLDDVKREPNKNKHFLLLEGPPGTGKTETITQTLAHDGHILYPWKSAGSQDHWMGQLLLRIITFFSDVKYAAKYDPNHFHCLFVDEIDTVCSKVVGTPEPSSYNRAATGAEFQKQIDDLRNINNVVLIGTTNCPNNIPKAMLDRAFRVTYPLPDKAARQKLLDHFFRQKRVDAHAIQRMVQLTSVWSTRQLLSLIASIEAETITEIELSHAYSQASRMVESDFRTAFPCSHLTLPVFDPSSAQVIAPALSNISHNTTRAFDQIAESLVHPELFTMRVHSLLYGPPGSGKTSAVRRFAQACNQPFVVIESGVSFYELKNVLEYVQTFGHVIVFIDEIDKITSESSAFREVLQEAMDGFNEKNMVIIGATNYPDKIARPVFDRFAQVMHVPALSEHQRSGLIVSILKDELFNAPALKMDDIITDWLTNPNSDYGSKLVTESQSMSIRAIKSKIAIFIGHLRVMDKKGQTGSNVFVSSLELLKCFSNESTAANHATFFSTSAIGSADRDGSNPLNTYPIFRSHF